MRLPRLTGTQGSLLLLLRNGWEGLERITIGLRGGLRLGRTGRRPLWRLLLRRSARGRRGWGLLLLLLLLLGQRPKWCYSRCAQTGRNYDQANAPENLHENIPFHSALLRFL